jgi:probable HAF family extracellular repeat protein
VAGTGVNPQGKTHAYRYTDSVGWEDLGVAPRLAPANSSTASGINDLGQVVGRSGSDSFRYTDGVGMVDLSDLHCTGFLDTCTGSASEINNSGQVIGWWYSNETLGGQRAVRFTDGLSKEIFELLSPLESWSFGIDINDAGQSVGYTVQLAKQGITIR